MLFEAGSGFLLFLAKLGQAQPPVSVTPEIVRCWLQGRTGPRPKQLSLAQARSSILLQKRSAAMLFSWRKLCRDPQGFDISRTKLMM